MSDEDRETIDLEFERAKINIALLHQELRLFWRSLRWREHRKRACAGACLHDTPAEVCDLAGPAVMAHDSASRTVEQQKEVDRKPCLLLCGNPGRPGQQFEKDRFLRLLAERLGIGE